MALKTSKIRTPTRIQPQPLGRVGGESQHAKEAVTSSRPRITRREGH